MIYIWEEAMFFSKFLVKNKYEKETFHKPEDAKRKDPIWGRRTINDVMVAMCNRLTKQSDYGENMDALTEEERVFYIATEVECEVNNGGFEQFFYESSGKFANEAAENLRIIGAENMAFFAEKALHAVGGKLPVDHAERIQFLKENVTDGIREVFEECDRAFEGDPDDFNAIAYKYLLEKKIQFGE